MRDTHVYIDVDDVLAETTRALNTLARTRFGRTVAFDDMAVFDLSVSLDLDPDEYTRFMEAAHEERFLLDLPPMTGAVAAVSGLYRSGAEISIVTGRPPGSRAVTEDWLERVGLPYHRLELVDKYGRYGTARGPSKEDLAERNFAVVIEDSLEMTEFFVERTDALVLLFDRPWNRGGSVDSERVRRVTDWRSVTTACGPTDRPGRRPAS